MTLPAELVPQIQSAVQPERLMETAIALLNVPSPTRSAGAVADRLGQILRDDGFDVARVECGWPDAPAVVATYDSGRTGRTVQFNGHLDVVHLPFVPPRIENGVLYGSGASDMKGGIAAMVEAMRALRDTTLPAGKILLTAHDLHEAPWGDGSQVDALIAAGYLGDAVLLPEYVCDRLPIAGRGLATLEVTVRREGVPVHEVLGGIDQPNVIHAGAEVVRQFAALDRRLASQQHEHAGRSSLFVGQVHSGEIFNQSPVELRLSGTRRWLPGADVGAIRKEIQDVVNSVADEFAVRIDSQFQVVRDAFELDPADPFVAAFQQAYSAITGHALPIGAKPFVDDGNTFAHRGRVPAITHGPNAKGAHTVSEEVPVAELVRVAQVYALTAVAYCGG